MFNLKIYCKYLDWTIPLILEDPDMDNWWIKPSIVMKKKHVEHIKHRMQWHFTMQFYIMHELILDVWIFSPSWFVME